MRVPSIWSIMEFAPWYYIRKRGLAMKRNHWSSFFDCTGPVCLHPDRNCLPGYGGRNPCTSAVAEMEDQGLLSGYPDGRFYPARTIPAAQFVTIAARCAGLEWVPAQTNHWAAGSLQAALQAGWYDWDELLPTGERFDLPVSRQLAVKILMRAFLPESPGRLHYGVPENQRLCPAGWPPL